MGMSTIVSHLKSFMKFQKAKFINNMNAHLEHNNFLDCPLVHAVLVGLPKNVVMIKWYSDLDY